MRRRARARRAGRRADRRRRRQDGAAARRATTCDLRAAQASRRASRKCTCWCCTACATRIDSRAVRSQDNDAAFWLSRRCCASPALLGGCAAGAWSAPARRGVQRYEDRRSTGTQVEDERIELRARAARIDERFGDKVHVNVTSYNRSVLLTGEVPDAATRAESREDRRAPCPACARSPTSCTVGRADLARRAHQRHASSPRRSRRASSTRSKFNPDPRQGRDRGRRWST